MRAAEALWSGFRTATYTVGRCWTAKRDLVDMVRSAWEAEVEYRRATPPPD